MKLYNIFAEAPVRGNQVKELYIFAETEEELQEKLPIVFKNKLKYSEKVDGQIDIISRQSWNLGKYEKKE